MSKHQTGNTNESPELMTAEALEGAIASLQDQLDFLVKILRALDDQASRTSASKAEYEATLLQQISDLTQRVVVLMERRKTSSGAGCSAGGGSRTTIPPLGDAPAAQDALRVMMRNVPLEETERDRLLAAERAESLRKRAFWERQSQLRAERERRLAARAGRVLRRWLGLSWN